MVDVRSRRAHVVGLVSLALLLFVPYALAGPGFFIDDWFALANGALDDWWMSAGPAQWRARPGAAAVYAVTFGLIGERPLAHFLLAAITMTCASVVLYRLSARFLPPLAAFGLAALWLVLPTHTSLEMWPSCLNIALALLLLLIGAERLTAPSTSLPNDVVAGVLFGLATFAYEAVAPVAGAAVVFIALGRSSWRRRIDAVVPSALAVGAAGLWMVANWHPDKEGLDVTMNPWFVIPAHFGETITGGVRWAEVLITVTVLVGSLAAARDLILEERRAATAWWQWTLAAGWAVIGLGTLPFVRYFYSPVGLGDRALVVSSLGGAMVLVGVFEGVRRTHSAGVWALTAVVIAVVLPQRYSMASDYATAADDGRRIRGYVERRWPELPDRDLVFGPEPIVRRNVVAFYDIDSAISLLYERRSAARMTYSIQEFERAPDDLRVDIRALSRLDDGRLGPDSRSGS